jgi:hypothetical protein
LITPGRAFWEVPDSINMRNRKIENLHVGNARMRIP